MVTNHDYERLLPAAIDGALAQQCSTGTEAIVGAFNAGFETAS
jgi:hypothetical protein